MKSIQEFVEMLQNEEFLGELTGKVEELQKEGVGLEEALSKAAEEKGFSVTPEEIKAVFDQSEELSTEELDQVAGGTTFTAGSYYFNKDKVGGLFGC